MDERKEAIKIFKSYSKNINYKNGNWYFAYKPNWDVILGKSPKELLFKCLRKNPTNESLNVMEVKPDLNTPYFYSGLDKIFYIKYYNNNIKGHLECVEDNIESVLKLLKEEYNFYVGSALELYEEDELSEKEKKLKIEQRKILAVNI